MSDDFQPENGGASPDRTRERAVGVVRALRAAGHEALFAGGCVRDHILGASPVDYDVATSALPEDVMALFDRTVAIGAAFGVVRVLVEDDEFEVATFRTEGGYSDGRHPDSVRWATAQEDVLRRDFTINGLLLDPLDGQGVVLDHVGGEADLAAGLIRAIGDPTERFAEDKLRLLRAVRFAARFDFTIEDATWAAVLAGAASITEVSTERIRDELERMWTQSAPGPGLMLLERSGLWPHVLPEIGDPARAVSRLADVGPLDAIVGWAVVAAELDPAAATDLARRMKLSSANARHLGEAATALAALTQYRSLGTAQRKRVLRSAGGSTALTVANLAGSAGQFPSEELAAAQADRAVWTEIDLFPARLISGQDLIDGGFAPGPRFKRALDAVEDAQLEGADLDQSKAISLAMTHLEGP
jgi:tRNA nucleotidyltransferase/poly(A) polymerase